MRKKLMLVGLAVVALLLIVAAVSVYNHKRQESAIRKVSDAFVASVLAGKSTDTYKLFTSDAQSKLSSSDWQDQVAQVSLFFTARKPNYSGMTSTSKTGENVTYNIAGNDGAYVFTVSMNEQNNQWLVASFRSVLHT